MLLYKNVRFVAFNPNPPHVSLHKALWARVSRAGHNVQEVKTTRKTQLITSKPQIYALHSLYFQRNPSAWSYFYRLY